MNNNTSSIFDKYKASSFYRVYRKDYQKSCLDPEGMLTYVLTPELEAGDITERPVKRPEAMDFIQEHYPTSKKGTLKKLIEKHGLTQHRVKGEWAHIFFRSEIRAAMEVFNAAKQAY
jgi:hypothetical protein